MIRHSTIKLTNPYKKMPKPLMDKPWHLSVDQTDVLVLHFLHARKMKQSKDPLVSRTGFEPVIPIVKG